MAETTLTTEEQLEQLRHELEQLKIQNAELADTNNKLKVSTSKANSEAADFKRKWQQTLSDAEKAEIARKESEEQTKAQLEELLKEKKTAKVETELVGMGFTKDNAADAATALVDGNLDGVVTSLNAFLAAHEKKVLEGALAKTPKPDTKGDPDYQGTLTKEQFRKLSYSQLLELKTKDPELYTKLSS